MIHRLRLCLIGLSLVATAPSFAAVGLYGIMNLGNASSTPRVTVPPTTAFSGKTGFGVGAFIRGTSNPIVNFELDIDYVARKLDGGAAGDLTFNMLEAPLFLRFTLPVVTVGVGGYYAYRLGDPKSSTGANPGTFRSHDFGLAGAVGAEFPVAGLSLFGEIRYLFGLANMDPDPIGTLYWRNWQFLAGVKFGVF